MQWSDKTILVTGAGGFVGNHLTEHLIDLGSRVKAFVRYNSRNDWGLLELLPRDKLNRVTVIMGDLRDSDARFVMHWLSNRGSPSSLFLSPCVWQFQVPE